MIESVDAFKQKLANISGGRLDPKLFDSLWIPDLSSNLKESAQIVPRSHTELVIKPFDTQTIDQIAQSLNLMQQPIQVRKEAQAALIVTLAK